MQPRGEPWGTHRVCSELCEGPCALILPPHPQALPYVALLIVMLFFIYAVIGMQVRGRWAQA